MNRVVLRRLGDAAVEAAEKTDAGTAVGAVRMPAGDLPGFVRQREAGPVRWVWDGTTRWYPALLAAGVRVERCADLRLRHALLRRSAFVEQGLLDNDASPGWDALQPVTATDPGLFPLDDPAGCCSAGFPSTPAGCGGGPVLGRRRLTGRGCRVGPARHVDSGRPDGDTG